MKLISPCIGNYDKAFVIIVCMTCCVCVNCQLFRRKESSETEADDDDLPEDHYSFVALIDIVFTNGAKKTCTGTIIHDNVVVTAAHCFYIKDNDQVQPEMTATFVVIGTKKMFDSGYEQYLPIERIIIHPKYKGWTADLALVHTFAGMVSDKPGHVVPLATERISTPVDSADVMVFSWGKCRDIDPKKSEEDTALKKEDDQRFRDGNNKRKRFRSKSTTQKTQGDEPVIRARSRTTRVSEVNKIERPMSSIEENNVRFKYQEQRYENLTDFSSGVEQISWENKLEKLNQLYQRSEVNKDRMFQRDRRGEGRAMSYYRNTGWRRKMGDQQNKLTVEIFGFVNLQSCQKLVQKAMPSHYRIQNRQEILCYASERRYITEDDAGAPAMRRGRLVAVTVGGAAFEGEHVAVGMKMVCYCNWIADNLPTGSKLHCCKNCCDATDEDAEKKENLRNLHKKRKL